MQPTLSKRPNRPISDLRSTLPDPPKGGSVKVNQRMIWSTRERWWCMTGAGRRWRSNPPGKCSQERLTRGTVTRTMRRAAHPSGCARCGAGAGCSAINYQSLWQVLAVGTQDGRMRLLSTESWEERFNVRHASRAVRPKPETRNPRPETRSPKPEIRNPKPETRNPMPETRNPKLET